MDGCAAKAAGMNNSTSRQSPSANRSARLYEAVKITRPRSAAAATTSGTGGSPKICAAPETPANSVTSAAMLVTSMVPSETHAHPMP